MRLFHFELKKVLQFPALWVFLGLCLALNTMVIFAIGSSAFFNETVEIPARLGQRMDAQFVEGVRAMPKGEARDNALAVAEGAAPFYENLRVEDELLPYYQSMVKESPAAMAIMAWKYGLLQGRVDHLAETGADMDFYAGAITGAAHKQLFGILLRMVCAESCLTALLLTLYLLGYENRAGTELFTYSSRRGRGLAKNKIAASLAASAGFFLLLTILTLAVYFALWHFPLVFDACIESQNNLIYDLLLVKPFITWADFSVGGYLLACLGLMLTLTLLFSLLGAVFGLLVKNTYAAVILCTLLLMAGLSLAVLAADLKQWVAYLVLLLQPVGIWLNQQAWFTEGGSAAICPWFETLSTVFHLILYTALLGLCLRRFSRKDVV